MNAKKKGRLVYAMGPSGAGKDSVLGEARRRVADLPIAFAHRYITRPPTPGDENHVALSEPEFAVRRAHGVFAMTWAAHGLHYGIGAEIELWRAAGLTVVVSGSREHFAAALADSIDILPVLITADPAVIESRLVERGRESLDAIRERVRRGQAYNVTHPSLVTIDNSGPLEKASKRLAELLRGS